MMVTSAVRTKPAKKSKATTKRKQPVKKPKALPMTTVQNLSRRLVTFSCNCGEHRHLSGGMKIELPTLELNGNSMVEKLTKRGLLLVTDVSKAVPKTRKRPASRKSVSKPATKTRKRAS